jgi:MATE family multidrug resistance protein
MRRPSRADFRNLIELALPLAAVQVGVMAMGMVDAAMVGRLSADALGAVAVAGVWFFAITTVGMGCVYALDPVIAQAHGAGDEPAIALGFQRGLLIAVLVTVPTMVGLVPVEAVLRLTGQAPALVPLARDYLNWIQPGIFPYFAFLVLRQTLQALGRVRPILAVITLANLLNAGLNWIFIYGHLGAPALGVRGSALATTISRWAMFTGLLGLTWKALEPYARPLRPEIWLWGPLRRMLEIGLPIGLQILFEYGVFGIVGLLLGRAGSQSIAGHQIALNYAAITFMVPLGIGAAAAVLVGRAIGANDAEGARRVTVAALAVGASFMAAAALVFIALPTPLAALYSEETGVVAIAASLIPIAGAFQVFDGTQAVAMGVLRGAGDTRVPVIVTIFGYYAVGLPVGLWLGAGLGLGAQGYWWGLVTGLAVVAVVLIWRIRSRMSRALTRLAVDPATP